jgi:hypothetical protein
MHVGAQAFDSLRALIAAKLAIKRLNDEQFFGPDTHIDMIDDRSLIDGNSNTFVKRSPLSPSLSFACAIEMFRSMKNVASTTLS